MSSNHSNVYKSIWRAKYVHEHHAYDKINSGYVNVGSFPQYFWCHLSWDACHVWTNNYVQMYKVL